MPLFDLSSQNGSLDPLAPFKVLAVMCHPADRAKRERMVGLIARETGGEPRRRPVFAEEFARQVVYHTTRAGAAGHASLTQLQLSANGYPYDLNLTIRLISEHLPKWEQPASSDWSKDAHVSHHPTSRRKNLAAIKEYRTVAHLWAAMIHAQQNDRPGIWPGDNATLPMFLAVAERFLDMACALPAPGRRSRSFLMSRSEAWRFAIPPDLVRQAGQVALLLHPDQLKIISEHVNPK